jgi:D-beta-D-heptose 7-phosphate kinase/D-beta-D-heptose 1-phosphate adenosyltransferase
MKIVLITGGFDPLHSGHITYIQAARKLAGKTGKLIVGVNSDAWLKSKKDYVVLDVDQRADIIENITGVDSVIEFDDSDGTAIDAIEQVKKMHPKDDIIFANGGDRTKDNIPEMKIKGVTFKFGVGGREKVYSSSDIIASVTSQLKETVERKWGSYSILYNRPDCKIKELMDQLTKARNKIRNLASNRWRVRSRSWQNCDKTFKEKDYTWRHCYSTIRNMARSKKCR